MKKIVFQSGGLSCHPVDLQADLIQEWLGAEYRVEKHVGTTAFDALDGCDLLVIAGLFWTGSPHITWMEPMPYEGIAERHRTAFREYVRSGRPVLGFHGGIASYDDWPEFGELLGFRWTWDITSHTKVDDWKVTVRKEGHPIRRGLDDYELNDELYFNVQVSPDMPVVVHGEAHYHDITFPMILTGAGGRIAGAGKTAYLANGHSMKSMTCPMLPQLWRNTVESFMKTLKIYRAAIVGVGKGGMGKAGIHSIGYAHAETYRKHPQFKLAGACDLNAENLKAFADTYGVSAHAGMEEMLREVRPDVVSLCTYAGSHRPLLEQCLAAGVKAIWCEKPLCLTIDDGRAMLEAAERVGAKVVVSHYRRYLHLFREARRLLREGAIGRLSLISSSFPDWDLMEWGTHWLDMMRFFGGDQPVSWVMGQARCSGTKKAYGHLMEEHSLCYFSFADGTRGLLDGGLAIPGNSALRLVGDEGTLDLRWDGKVLLLNRDGLREIPVRSNLHDPLEGHSEENGWQSFLNDFAAWLDGGAEPQCALGNALLSSELYLAAYESARIGDRVDLPLMRQDRFPLDEIARRQTPTSSPA